MLWAVFALFAGWMNCIQSELNRHFKIDGFRLNTFRALISALIMIPLIPFMEWPAIPEYYLVVILEAAISVVGMMVQYNLAAKHNGRVSNLHQPISIMLTFSFWILIDEAQRQFLLDHPVKLGLIALAFIIFVTSLQFIRRNDLGVQILLAVIPVAVLYSLMTVISKIALQQGETLFQIAINFVFLTNIAMFLISFPVFLSQRMKDKAIKIDKPLLKASLFVGASHTISWVFFAMTIILTPNPAYPGFITGLAPVWFMIYYKMRKERDDASPIAGLCLSAAALIMLYVTQ